MTEADLTEGRALSVLAGSALAFVTSGVVLVLEILAARMLAPYIGVTLETYTGIIGVVLAGISAGSWLGGRLADRTNPRAILGPMILLGGLAALCVPFVVDAVGPRTPARSPSGIVVLAFSGFFLPAFVLSGVTPTVAKLQLRSLRETGHVVGRLSAISTAGAIFGTFVSGFVLVAAFPVRVTVIALGLLLAVLGVATSLLLSRGRTHVLGLVAAAGLGVAASAAPGPCQLQTVYYCVRITPDALRASGRTLMLDDLRHSYVDLTDPEHLEFAYTQAIVSVIDAQIPPERPLRALHVGGGGFTLPRYLAATRASVRSVVLELDPRVVDTARDHLGLELSDSIRVRVGDARMSLLDEREGAYDVVVGDAFGSLSVPWHLTTVEFLEMVRRVLRDDGLYAVNVIDYPPLRFARAEAATLRAVFPHVIGVARPGHLDGSTGGNFVFVGSMRPIDVTAVRRELASATQPLDVATTDEVAVLAGEARVLRDDHAPVDQLLTIPR